MSVPAPVPPPVAPDVPTPRPEPAGEVAMVAVDFDPDGLVIEPCECCLQVWWAELVLVDQRVQLREWHRSSCPEWGDMVSCPTPASVGLTAGSPVVRGSGLRGLHTVDAGRGEHA